MRYLNLILLSLILLSCQDKRKAAIEHLVSEWQGKEIVFPNEMVFTRFLTDTVPFDLSSSSYKVLIYVDSMGCTSCKLQLSRWEEFIKKVDSLSENRIPFLFVFQSNNRKEIRYLLKRDGFSYPISLDSQGILNQRNQFPNDITFQTFLLDKGNRVSVIGNPIHNLAVKELYIQQIKGSDSHKTALTQANITPESIHIGKVRQSQPKEVTFTLTNTGNNPLVIFDAATTCGCAEPHFDKHPASPGQSLSISVTMTPKDKGFFNEVISLKCNTEQNHTS